jgi:hypothetical protein
VRPNGMVVVPFADATVSHIQSIVSTNGGSTYTGPFNVATIAAHPVAGSLRSPPLPSAEVDAAGQVYVVWADCRFRSNCTQNDIVMSTSMNGTTWSAVVRVPIDATTSTVDHFIPGLAVDRETSGSTARLALTYYSYPQASCTSSTCQLEVGHIQSTNGGTSWGAPTTLAGPMSLGWLASTSQGRMVGDYISTSFVGTKAFPVFALANEPDDNGFDEAITTVAGGVTVSGGNASARAERAQPTTPVRATPAVRTAR